MSLENQITKETTFEKLEDDIIELIYKEIEAGGKEQNRIGIKNATNENLLIAIRYEAIQYPKQRLYHHH